MTSFSRQKPLKTKNKKHRIFWNTEFYHPAKVELKRIKNAKVVPSLQLFACVLAQRDLQYWLTVSEIVTYEITLILMPIRDINHYTGDHVLCSDSVSVL